MANSKPESKFEDVWKLCLTVFVVVFVVSFAYYLKLKAGEYFRPKEVGVETVRNPFQASNEEIYEIGIYKGIWTLPVPVKNQHIIEWAVVESDVWLDVEINGTTIVTQRPSSDPLYRDVWVEDILKQVRFRICPDPDKVSGSDRATVRVILRKKKFSS